MSRRLATGLFVVSLIGIVCTLMPGSPPAYAAAAAPAHGDSESSFPRSLESYDDADMKGLWNVLRHRIEVEPFNLWATIIFLCAIIHTFMTHRFRHIAHVLEERHREQYGPKAISAAARLFHFLGEIEAVFGIWVVPLLAPVLSVLQP